MTIKQIKQQLSCMESIQGLTGKKSFTVYDFYGFGKCIVCVINDPYLSRFVVACVQVSTGKDLFNGSHSRPCDNMSDSIDVTNEILSDMVNAGEIKITEVY